MYVLDYIEGPDLNKRVSRLKKLSFLAIVFYNTFLIFLSLPIPNYSKKLYVMYMNKKYSLKRVFTEAQNISLKNDKKDFLNESFWTDLAVVVATGGKDGVKQMIKNKLEGLVKKTASMDSQKTLDMVQRFKKMGISNMWGEDLDALEKELTKRLKDGNEKTNKIDSKKLMAALGLEEECKNADGYSDGILEEEDNPFKNVSIRTLFL